METTNALGQFLRQARDAQNLSLREVEKQTGVSNAYISQLESGKMAQPSPTILHKLCQLYEVSYGEAFQLAGHPVPSSTPSVSSPALRRLGSVTEKEADQLAKYLSFLRSQEKK